MLLLFVIGIFILVIGYKTYSVYVVKQLDINPDRVTPAININDGVDFVPLPKRKNQLIQLLNIAGTGPIYGPIAAAVFGPIGLIIIPIGNILAGAVHDVLIAVISVRNNGSNLPILATKYIGKWSKIIITIFTSLLLILVATIFVTSPAQLITSTIDINYNFVLLVIFIYYIISTIAPIDKIIGKIYPYITIILLVGTLLTFISVLFMTLMGNIDLPKVTFDNILNWNPTGTMIVPGFFVMVSCGLISGFHSTQSPIVSKTIKTEAEARETFYLMMVVEGVIAMIWAFVTMALFDPTTISETTQPVLIGQIAAITLGSYLSWLLILAVIVLPITSGDTAFRSLRSIIAEVVKYDQKPITNRLILCAPIFLTSLLLLTVIDFSSLWLYFTWSNHMLAVFTLFTAAAYLKYHKKNHLIAIIPGMILLYIDTLYLLTDLKIGFGLNYTISIILSIIITIIFTYVITKISRGYNLVNKYDDFNDDELNI